MLISTKMKKEYSLDIKIPAGVACEIKDKIISCKKGSDILERKIVLLDTAVNIKGDEIKFFCKKANKKDIAKVKAFTSHLNYMFKGFEEKFVYELEICNVHFPITAKVDGSKLVINNFLGEKKNRVAEIISGVKVEINGQKITVSGKDMEKAGQTAANIEKTTKVAKRDRRVFQDGIFITRKPGREM